MLKRFSLLTKQQDMIDITQLVKNALNESGVQSGMCTVFCPHTTAAITINENSDPDVINDILLGLNQSLPERNGFMHSEGNSAAHIKSSLTGASESIIIDEGRLVIGIWQAIYFCEFDGPRNRTFYVKIQQDHFTA